MSGFRMKGSPKRTTMLSTCGVVIGGPYDRHRYAFLGFSCTARGALRIELRVSKPGWPFPTDVSLTKLDFRHLEPIKGERATRVDTSPLIEAACRAHVVLASSNSVHIQLRSLKAQEQATMEPRLDPAGTPPGAR